MESIYVVYNTLSDSIIAAFQSKEDSEIFLANLKDSYNKISTVPLIYNSEVMSNQISKLAAPIVSAAIKELLLEIEVDD